jgi:hypothetical protein
MSVGVRFMAAPHARREKKLARVASALVAGSSLPCERVGSYGLADLISAYGIDTRLPDLLAELSADCPKRAGQGLGTDRCGAVYLVDVEKSSG